MRNYVDTRWGQLHYSSVGSGPAVVCFHETPLSHRAWERLAAELGSTHQVIAFDTPGYGESDPPPGITTMEEYGATLAEGMVALGLEDVTVCGVHTGASIALEVAARSMPDRVSGLVIIGLPFYPEEVRLAKVPAVVPEFRDDGQHLLESFHRPPAEYDNELLSRMAGAVCEYPDRAFWGYHAVYAYDPAAALPIVKVPTLFLSNSVDPLYGGDNEGMKLVTDGRQVEIESDVLPLYWTQPSAVAAEIRRFTSGD